jgi:predicted permease
VSPLFDRCLSRIRAVFTKPALDADFDDELTHHLQLLIEENLKAGMPSDEARRHALIALGGIEQLREMHRETRGLPWLENLFKDLGYGVRQLRNNPGFATVAVLTLALAISINTVVFSLVDEVLLKLLPVKNPQELVFFRWSAGPRGWEWPADASYETDPGTKVTTCTSFSAQTFERFRAHRETLTDMFAFAPLRQPTVSAEGQVEISPRGQLVSGGYFAGLGVPAWLGRIITPEDDQAGAPPVVVISFGYWQRRFGGDPGVVGKKILVNNAPATVIGVTPLEFAGTLDIGDAPDLSVPLAMLPQVWPERADQLKKPVKLWWLRLMGRVRPGVTGEEVRLSLEQTFRQSSLDDLAVAPVRPPLPDGGQIDVPRLDVQAGGQGLTESRHSYTRELMILSGLVGLVLLTACANVANLLLVRGVARRREIAVRLAMGASRGRLVRQFLVEHGLLAFLGAASGVGLAFWGRGLLLAMHPLLHEDGRPLVLNLDLDHRVLGFTSIVAIFTGILFGLVPALRATRVDLTAEFQGGMRTHHGGSRSMLGRALVVVQVALSIIMLVGAGLCVRTLRNLQGIDVGFNREHLLLFRLDAKPLGYKNAQIADLHGRIASQIGSLPGVQSVTFSTVPSLSRSGWNSRISVQGRPPSSDWRDSAMINAADVNYFATFGLPILLGRGFTLHDDASAPKVAVINQKMAEEYFGKENPVGRRFGREGPESAGQIEIVGVVHDAKYSDVRAAAPATAYFPYLQQVSGEANFAVRVSGDPEAQIVSVNRAVRTVSPNLPLADVRTQETQIERLFAQERLFARLAGFFGLFAVALVCLGLYGLMSYSVLRRTGEIGIRMAMGAQRNNVLWLVLLQGLAPVGVGIAAGLAGAAGVTRLLQSLLYGVEPNDAVTFALASLLLAVVALLACAIPAWRATRVDPMVALRHE